MTFDSLEASYWEKQLERVEAIRSRIAGRAEVLTEGRVVPQDSELSQGLGRRLNLAVMFFDIVGSSKRALESSSEQAFALRVYDLFFTEIIRVAEEYGGEVEKNTGDGLMIYFSDSWLGSNTAADNGPKRALASVMTMKYVTDQSINKILARDGDAGIRFRAGIDYGPITIAQIGAARRFGNRVALGNTANVASKMLNGVDDQIIVGENVFNMLPELWKQNCTVLGKESGYHFEKTKQPYRFFSFDARWNGPQ